MSGSGEELVMVPRKRLDDLEARVEALETVLAGAIEAEEDATLQDPAAAGYARFRQKRRA